jgi:hypothetical protein
VKEDVGKINMNFKAIIIPLVDEFENVTKSNSVYRYKQNNKHYFVEIKKKITMLVGAHKIQHIVVITIIITTTSNWLSRREETNPNGQKCAISKS